MNKWLPVRVIRGFKHESDYSPKNWYVYSWLYSVVEAWEEKGKSGFKICRFRLIDNWWDNSKEIPSSIEFDYTKKKQKRIESTTMRIVRDTKTSRDIKNLYNYECQVCWLTIESKKSRYAEWAHIRPLGKPHNWDDMPNNLLCLCPNHHVMFDKWIFSINDNLTFCGYTGIEKYKNLNLSDNHKINTDNLIYHRSIHGYH